MTKDVKSLLIDNYADRVINGNIISGKRQERGFIDSDCDYIEGMLSNIALQAVENSGILNNSRKVNLGHLINVLSYA